MLAHDLLWIASVLRSGDASAYHQVIAASQLVRIAEQVRRMEEHLDLLIGDAAVEARRRAFHLVETRHG
jgi:hypothetical protein